MDNLSEFIMANMGLFIALMIVLGLIARNLIMPARITPVDSMGAIRMMNQQNALVVDVRGNDEYQKGHILNSMHIPLALIESKQSELAPFKNEQIILVCRSGNRSYQAGLTLKKLGYENLHNLKGGMGAWQHAGLPMTSKPTKGKHKIKKKVEPKLESMSTDDGGDSQQADAGNEVAVVDDTFTDVTNDVTNDVAATEDSAVNTDASSEKSEKKDNNEVLVYTTKQCPFCDRAVDLLSKKGIGYTEIRIDEEPSRREEMEQKSSRKSVPQIFVGETHVGGFDDMYMLESEGRLNTVFGIS